MVKSVLSMGFSTAGSDFISDEREAGTDYVAEVDNISAAGWDELVQSFDDANLYQTWAHAGLKWGHGQLSHLILKRAGAVVAVVQVAIVSVPLLGPRMGHIRFGPLWLRKGSAPDPDVYRAMLAAMRTEYCERRGLLLRLKPWDSIEEQESLALMREAAGFKRQERVPTYDTFVLDLAFDVEKIHSGLAQSWRRDLKRAKNKNFTTRCSRDPADLEVFLSIYREMNTRSQFADFTDIHLLAKMFGDLPEKAQPHIMLCFEGNTPVSGIVFSVIGDRALALFGASTTSGLHRGASYIANWEVLIWLKENSRCRWYDLVGGLGNPGIYHFKAGLAKGCGTELNMGDYDAGGSLITKFVVYIGERLRPSYAKLRASKNRL
jgi:peptidoglycan pentaglycine glycine transferase (the first glycine)